MAGAATMVLILLAWAWRADDAAPATPRPEPAAAASQPAAVVAADARPDARPDALPDAPWPLTATDAAASTAGEGPAPQALPAWHRLGLELPVDALIRRAAASPDPDDRASVVHLLAWCSAVASAASGDPASVQGMVSVANGTGANLPRVMAQVMSARNGLRRLCDEPALNGLVDSGLLRKPLAGAAMSPVRRLMFGEQQRDPERYAQAVQQVLSNPQAHPLALDLWLQQQLRHNLPAAVADDAAQRHHVHEQLLNRLAGPAAPEGLRALARCAAAFVCPASTDLSTAQRATADAAADRLETAIREQRWTDLRLF